MERRRREESGKISLAFKVIQLSKASLGAQPIRRTEIGARLDNRREIGVRGVKVSFSQEKLATIERRFDQPRFLG